MTKIRIALYHPDLKQDFVRLNVDWLEEFFFVEPVDEMVLNQCEQKIIAPGGHIFFLLRDNTVLGTVALMKTEEGVFELTKMSVDKTLRGKGYGKTLLQHCIDFAKRRSWKKLILYSNTKLENAIHLYQKFGFCEIPVEAGCVYERCNIKMELLF
ncbi:MAG: GNAT family N-acetyltransferase [Flavobacteriaceae bacterium]|nr:GNAT family N-acetyltransferase [Flavobacteriaceae bacterium]